MKMKLLKRLIMPVCIIAVCFSAILVTSEHPSAATQGGYTKLVEYWGGNKDVYLSSADAEAVAYQLQDYATGGYYYAAGCGLAAIVSAPIGGLFAASAAAQATRWNDTANKMLRITGKGNGVVLHFWYLGKVSTMSMGGLAGWLWNEQYGKPVYVIGEVSAQ
jgi:hypothetical protein